MRGEADWKLLFITIKPPPEEYLAHYGVKGMKWGVRRYQNPDGSLTQKGKKRFQKVSNSRIRSAMDTASAKAIEKHNIKDFQSRSRYTDEVSKKNYQKIDKLVTKSEKRQVKGDQAGFEKYQSKAWKQTAKMYNNMVAAKYWSDAAEVSKARLSDISSGKLQAGRDFIVSRQTYIVPLGPTVGVFTEKGIVYKNK